MPANKELETAVLAVILDGRHRQAVHVARSSITSPLVFSERNHRIVWLAICDIDDHGHAVDANAVSELLSRQKFHDTITRLRRLEFGERASIPKFHDGYDDSTLAQIGGFNAVTDIAGSFIPASTLPRNVALLVDLFGKRVLIAKLREIADKAEMTPDAMPALLDLAGQAILDLGRGANTSQLYTAKEVWDETAAQMSEKANGGDAGGVKTGISGIDALLTQMRNGGLYLLAARPGCGKTSVALAITMNACMRGDGVLMFSLEVDRTDLNKKVISSLASVDFRDMDAGRLTREDQAAVDAAGDEFAKWPLQIMDTSDLTIGALRSIVKRRILEKDDIKLIVIDHMGLLMGSKKDQSEYEKVTEISRTLKVMCRELRKPILCLSQMSRDSEKGDSPRKPRLSDLRSSGALEQDADAVVFLHREGGEDSYRDISVHVAKNRFGPTGQTSLTFSPATMTIGDASAVGSGDRFQRGASEPSDQEDVF